MEEPYVSERVRERQEIDSDIRRKKHRRLLREIVLYVVLFTFCIYILPTFLLQKTFVEGPSMENTLYNGDTLLVDKFTYRFLDPERFDVIVFYPQNNHDSEYYVKRIIGLPGETVQIIGSTIYINDEALEESYGKDAIQYAGLASDPIILGEEEYFVLGDNRTVSLDSRYEEVGRVTKESIAGRPIFRVWPLDEFGPVH
ncbi:MAG: signal peptidase I [Lachnospiraceae bacterium]|nr:signal peptidase I [Lachnospiraceae bacterium]